MAKPPSPQTVRTTIALTPEVYATFQRMAEATGMSMSRCMGQWLEDTSDAAEHVAQLVENARASPRLVSQQLHAYALGLTDETGALMEKVAGMGRTERAQGALRSGVAATAAVLQPFQKPKTPPSNTGVTNTKNKNRKGGTDAQQNVR
jgi:hypothetical protein